jgi:hypothetical protein
MSITPGRNLNAGRPAGARNRLSSKFLKDVLAEWEVSGPGVLRIMRIERPCEFAKLVASVIPREFVFEGNALAEMSDEEIAGLLQKLQQLQLANKHIAAEQEAPEDTRH